MRLWRRRWWGWWWLESAKKIALLFHLSKTSFLIRITFALKLSTPCPSKCYFLLKKKCVTPCRIPDLTARTFFWNFHLSWKRRVMINWSFFDRKLWNFERLKLKKFKNQILEKSIQSWPNIWSKFEKSWFKLRKFSYFERENHFALCETEFVIQGQNRANWNNLNNFKNDKCLSNDEEVMILDFFKNSQFELLLSSQTIFSELFEKKKSFSVFWD